MKFWEKIWLVMYIQLTNLYFSALLFNSIGEESSKDIFTDITFTLMVISGIAFLVAGKLSKDNNQPGYGNGVNDD